MKNRLARCSKITRDTLKSVKRVRYNQAGHGFSFPDKDPGSARVMLLNVLPHYCEVSASHGRVYVSVYPW